MIASPLLDNYLYPLRVPYPVTIPCGVSTIGFYYVGVSIGSRTVQGAILVTVNA